MNKIHANRYDIHISFNQDIADTFNNGTKLELGELVYNIIHSSVESNKKSSDAYRESIKAELIAEGNL